MIRASTHPTPPGSATLAAKPQGRRRLAEGTGEPLDRSSDWGTLGLPRDPALARLLHVVETDVAVLRHAHYEPGAHVPLHRHDSPSLVYGVGGPCTELNGSAQVIRRRLTFLPRDHRHELQYRGPTHVLAIEIPPESLSESHRHRLPSALTPLPATLYDLVWRVLLDIASRAPTAEVRASLRGLVEASTRCLVEPPSPLAAALVDELHRHWRDVPSVAQLARKYSLSSQYLCRTFKKATGVTLQRYGLLLRLDYARGLLWGTDSSIADVAAQTGFADQSHLTRGLAAHSAWTPLRLRWLAPCGKDFLRSLERGRMANSDSLYLPSVAVLPSRRHGPR
jgi:AraC-like DNA-binding protein